MAAQSVSIVSRKLLINTADPSETNRMSLSDHIKIIWLAGILVLLPFDIINLPLNMTLMDCWVLMGLPFFWFSFIQKKQMVKLLSYMVPMWLILLGSFASIFVAAEPRNSFIVILKEVYIFVWFITILAVLCKIHVRDFHRLLNIWSGVVILHGFVIILQFLSKDFFRLTTSLAGVTNSYELYRASGLLTNPNKAAFFQLLGFVPVILASPSKKTGMILGSLLLLSILATGSMGATLGFIAGLTIAVTAISLLGHLDVIFKFFVRSVLIVSLIGGALFFVVNQNENYQHHFEQIIIGRIDRSSEGRLKMWKRAMEVFEDKGIGLWGIGPENFREVDWQDKQLHNDFFAFSIERGMIALLGLVLFATMAAIRAGYLLLLYNKHPDPGGLVVVVFLAAITGTLIESLTHQTFHFRELWVVLAFQEAMLFRLTTSTSNEPAICKLNDTSPHACGLVGQSDVSSG